MKPLRNKLQPTRDLEQSIAFLYEELNRTNEAVNRSMGFGQTDRQGEVGDLRTIKNDAEDTLNLTGKGDYGWYITPNDLMQPLGKGGQWLKRLRFDNRAYLGSVNNSNLNDWQLGKGWRIEETSGDVNNPIYHMYINDLTINGTLRAWELLLQQVRASKGDIIISPGNGKVKSISDASVGDEYVEIEDPETEDIVSFVVGDIVLCQRVEWNGSTKTVTKLYVRRIAQVSGNYVRLEGGVTGAPADTNSVEVGDELVVIGNTSNTSRDGSIYISTTQDNSPFIRVLDGVTNYSEFISESSIVAQLGNLGGLTYFDGATIADNTYGLKVVDNILIGKSSSGTGIELTTDDGKSITNGFAVYNAASPKMLIGNESGNYITWDTATGALNIKGDVTITNPDDFGGVVIYASFPPSTRPDGTDLQAGDIWIYSTDNNRIFTYDGTTPYHVDGWVAGTANYDGIAIDTQRKATVPTTRSDGGALVSGDIWFCTTDIDDPVGAPIEYYANTIYRYTGLAWEAFSPVGTEITGDGIYTGTLTADQVNAVDINAGSITTGELTSIVVRSGMTSFADTSNVGYWLGVDGDTYPKFKLYYNASTYLSYDSSSASLVLRGADLDADNITTGTISADYLEIGNRPFLNPFGSTKTIDTTNDWTSGGTGYLANYGADYVQIKVSAGNGGIITKSYWLRDERPYIDAEIEIVTATTNIVVGFRETNNYAISHAQNYGGISLNNGHIYALENTATSASLGTFVAGDTIKVRVIATTSGFEYIISKNGTRAIVGEYGNETSTTSSRKLYGSILTADTSYKAKIYYFHINGSEQGVVIDGGSIYASSITADKMSVTELSAITAVLGTAKSSGTIAFGSLLEAGYYMGEDGGTSYDFWWGNGDSYGIGFDGSAGEILLYGLTKGLTIDNTSSLKFEGSTTGFLQIVERDDDTLDTDAIFDAVAYEVGGTEVISSTRALSNITTITTSSNIQTGGTFKSSDGSSGLNTSFTIANGDVVTVKGGIITAITTPPP